VCSNLHCNIHTCVSDWPLITETVCRKRLCTLLTKSDTWHRYVGYKTHTAFWLSDSFTKRSRIINYCNGLSAVSHFTFNIAVLTDVNTLLCCRSPVSHNKFHELSCQCTIVGTSMWSFIDSKYYQRIDTEQTKDNRFIWCSLQQK